MSKHESGPSRPDTHEDRGRMIPILLAVATAHGAGINALEREHNRHRAETAEQQNHTGLERIPLQLSPEKFEEALSTLVDTYGAEHIDLGSFALGAEYAQGTITSEQALEAEEKLEAMVAHFAPKKGAEFDIIKVAYELSNNFLPGQKTFHYEPKSAGNLSALLLNDTGHCQSQTLSRASILQRLIERYNVANAEVYIQLHGMNMDGIGHRNVLLQLDGTWVQINPGHSPAFQALAAEDFGGTDRVPLTAFVNSHINKSVEGEIKPSTTEAGHPKVSTPSFQQASAVVDIKLANTLPSTEDSGGTDSFTADRNPDTEVPIDTFLAHVDPTSATTLKELSPTMAYESAKETIESLTKPDVLAVLEKRGIKLPEIDPNASKKIQMRQTIHRAKYLEDKIRTEVVYDAHKLIRLYEVYQEVADQYREQSTEYKKAEDTFYAEIKKELDQGGFGLIESTNILPDALKVYVELVMIYFRDIETKKTDPIYKKYSEMNFSDMLSRANTGDAEAMGNIGAMYKMGINIVQDNEKAFYWIKKSAEAGDARSEFNLTILYDQGIGVTADQHLAQTWLERSAKHGYAYAQFRIGRDHYRDYDFDKTTEQWWTKGAKQGDPSSQVSLGHVYSSQQKYTLAKHYLELFVTNTNHEIENYNAKKIDAYYELGRIYREEGDVDKAIILFEKSIVDDDPQSHLELAELYVIKHMYAKAKEHVIIAIQLPLDPADKLRTFGIRMDIEAGLGEIIPLPSNSNTLDDDSHSPH